MAPQREIVVTGMGVVSPIGIGKDPFWAGLCAGKSGIRRLELFDDPDLPSPIGGEVADFARFLLARQDDERWEHLLADPKPRPKLDLAGQSSSEDQDGYHHVRWGDGESKVKRLVTGATNIKPDDNMRGYYCGACHNGKMMYRGAPVFAACSKTSAPPV